ncbi:unnamed protein product [Boreogadus saida]
MCYVRSRQPDALLAILAGLCVSECQHRPAAQRPESGEESGLPCEMGDDRPFACTAPGCGQRFTNEDHLSVHKHKHEMTLKFGPARTDSVIIADQTPTPTRFLKNCEEVGLFNELAHSFEQEFRKAQDDDHRTKNTNAPLQTPSEVKGEVQGPLQVDSSPPGSPDSISSMSDDSREPPQEMEPPMPAPSSAPTPTIVRPGSLPLHMGFDSLNPTLPSPTSVITQTPPSNRQLGSPTASYPLVMHLPNGQTLPLLPSPVQMTSVISLARPMNAVPNVPGIPGPPVGGASSGSSSPSGYSMHADSKMRLKAALTQQGLVVHTGSARYAHTWCRLPGPRYAHTWCRLPGPRYAHTWCRLPGPRYAHTWCRLPGPRYAHTWCRLPGPRYAHTWCRLPGPRYAHTWCRLPGPRYAHTWCRLPGPRYAHTWCRLPGPRYAHTWCRLSGPRYAHTWCRLSGPRYAHTWCRLPQVSPAQPTGGRRRRASDVDPDERRQRFLERNRAAASRCRQKRKVWVGSLEKKADDLANMNVNLSTEVTLLRNEVTQLKQLLLAHKDCPVTAMQKKNAFLAAGGEESSREPSAEPLGSPAAVIQHGPPPGASGGAGAINGLSVRAAEAVAMSVLAGMGAGQPAGDVMTTTTQQQQQQPTSR